MTVRPPSQGALAPTAHVQTTLGPLPAAALGRINAHEHLILEGGYTTVSEPDFKLDNVEKAIQEVARWQAAGGGAILDAQPFGCGRNVDKLIAVSQATKLPIVVATGFQHRKFYLPDHWQYRYEDETLHNLLLAECVEGVDANGYDGPQVRRSPVKAGAIKVAGDYNYVSANMRRLIGVVGQVHRTTGLPVFAHTEVGTACDDLLDLLEAAGVAPERVMISHVDRNPDPWLHKRLAARGAYLQYDTPSRAKYLPDSTVAGLLRTLVDAGFADRLLLGGDLARRSYWRSYGGGPGLDYLLAVFTPRLRDEGFTDAELDLIWRQNPARWLTPCSPA
ncbi:MAG: phosphotriesterase family protein [Caldilineaceae bacterium]